MSLTQEIRGKIIAEAYKGWQLEGKKVLDVGSGNGVVSQVLVNILNVDLTAIDILNYSKTDVKFIQLEKEDHFPFDDLAFDYVMFNDILHHSTIIEKLIIEAKRVGKEILIFEEYPSLFNSIFDVTVNFFYSHKMDCPLNFKTKEQWVALFDKLDLAYQSTPVSTPPLYPLKHMAFKLIKK